MTNAAPTPAVLAAMLAIRAGETPNAATCRSVAARGFIVRATRSVRRRDNKRYRYGLTDAGLRVIEEIEFAAYRERMAAKVAALKAARVSA